GRRPAPPTAGAAAGFLLHRLFRSAPGLPPVEVPTYPPAVGNGFGCGPGITGTCDRTGSVPGPGGISTEAIPVPFGWGHPRTGTRAVAGRRRLPHLASGRGRKRG